MPPRHHDQLQRATGTVVPGIALISCISVLNLQLGLATAAIESVKTELENTGIANAAYDSVIFTFHPSFASQQLLAQGNWDEAMRHTVRTILDEARQNFHRHPRPW